MKAHRWVPLAVSAGCALAIALLRPRPGGASEALPPGALARVGERILTEVDVQRRLALLGSTAWGARAPARRPADRPPPAVPDARTVLDTLIEEELLFLHGRALGYLEDDTVRRHVVGRVWEETARAGGEAGLRVLLEELRRRHGVQVLRAPSSEVASGGSAVAPLADAVLAAVTRDLADRAPLTADQQRALRTDLTAALERLAAGDPEGGP